MLLLLSLVGSSCVRLACFGVLPVMTMSPAARCSRAGGRGWSAGAAVTIAAAPRSELLASPWSPCFTPTEAPARDPQAGPGRALRSHHLACYRR